MNFGLLFVIFALVYLASLIVRFFWLFGKSVKGDWPRIKQVWREEKEKAREQKMRDAEAHEDLDSTTMQAKRDHDR